MECMISRPRGKYLIAESIIRAALAVETLDATHTVSGGDIAHIAPEKGGECGRDDRDDRRTKSTIGKVSCSFG
jgi:hypothetical protein